MTGVHFSTAGDGHLRLDHLAEVVSLHRAFGLIAAIAGDEIPLKVAVTLDGGAHAAMTELLRLAHVGVEAERQVRAGVDGKVTDLVNDADVTWKAGFK